MLPVFNQLDLWSVARPAALCGAGLIVAVLLAAGWLFGRVRVLWPLAVAALAAALLPLQLHERFLPLSLLASPLLPLLAALLFLLPVTLAAVYVLLLRGSPRLRDVPSALAGQTVGLAAVWLLGGPFLVGPAVFDGALTLSMFLPLLLVGATVLRRWRTQPGGRLLVAGAMMQAVAGAVLLLAVLGMAKGSAVESIYLLLQVAAPAVYALAAMAQAERPAILGGTSRAAREAVQKLQDDNRLLAEQAARLENEKATLNSRRSLLEAEAREAENKLSRLTQTADAFHKLSESIDYARRIQQALVPSEPQLAEDVGESFILNQPRDNVSGDFLWCSKLADGWALLCVADCTGHGVPGAFMSALGTMLLTQVVTERGVRRPDQVLFAVDRSLRGALASGGTHVDDGMEAAVLLLSPDRRTALFCGARRPLVHCSEGNATLVEGTKRPIGGRPRANAPQFEMRRLSVRPGDFLYLSSDGFQDQLGGPAGRRYMSGRFSDTLNWIAGLPIKEQRPALEKVLTTWRGTRPQTDDVLVVGVKV